MKAGERKKKRARLFARTFGFCEYCLTWVAECAGTIDHYIPLARGGSDYIGNMRWCCRKCNRAKGSMSPQEWEACLREQTSLAPPNANIFASSTNVSPMVQSVQSLVESLPENFIIR